MKTIEIGLRIIEPGKKDLFITRRVLELEISAYRHPPSAMLEMLDLMWNQLYPKQSNETPPCEMKDPI